MAIVLSPHSNRPIDERQPVSAVKPLIFWCGICNLKLHTPTQAMQHLYGHSHKSKLNTKNNVNVQNNINHVAMQKPKHGLDSKNQEPASKKSKVQQQPENTNGSDKLFCSDCDITLNSATTAKMHFNGKKHASVVAAKKTWPLSSGKQHVTSSDEGHSSEQISTQAKRKKEKPIQSFCNDCNILLNSDEQVVQHSNGTKHKLNAGIISQPPDRWLANQRGRGRGGDGGAFRGDRRNAKGQSQGVQSLGLSDDDRFGHFGDSFDEDIGGFIMQAQGRGFGEGGIFKMKGDWSVRGQGLKLHGFNKDNIVKRGNLKIRAGLVPGKSKRGLQGTMQNKRARKDSVPTRGGGAVMVAGHHENGFNEPASIPGAKKSLSDYFVNASTAKDCFQPPTIIDTVNDNSFLNTTKGILNKKAICAKTMAGDKNTVNITLTNASKSNKHGMKATVPGGKGSLSGYFVNAGSQDHFKIDGEKKATVPGGKGLLKNYFVAVGSDNHFIHNISSRNPYYKPKMVVHDSPHVYRSKLYSTQQRNHQPDYSDSHSKHFYEGQQYLDDYYGYPESKEWDLPPHPKDYGPSKKNKLCNDDPCNHFGNSSPPPENIYNRDGNYYSRGYNRNGYSNSHDGYRNEPDFNDC